MEEAEQADVEVTFVEPLNGPVEKEEAGAMRRSFFPVYGSH